MKVGITSKLFLAIPVTCVAAAVAMGAAMRYSFESGFGRYLVGRDDEEVTRVTKALEREYAEHGSWAFITERPGAWIAFVRSVTPIFPHEAMGPEGWGWGEPPGAYRGPRWGEGRFGPPVGDEAGHRDGRGWGEQPGSAPAGLDGSGDGRYGSPSHDPREAAAPASTSASPDSAAAASIPAWHRDRAATTADLAFPTPPYPGQGPRDGWREHPPGFHHPPPIALYNAGRHRIAGYPPPPGTPLHALNAGGKLVGWLSMARPGGLFYAADQRFQMQQSRATWVIVIAAAVLSALVSMVLARLILAPVRRIVHATHRLAEGQYAVRVPERGSD
ncbi:MAG: HAMP domain-containing protein [Burkholderia sp.]